MHPNRSSGLRLLLPILSFLLAPAMDAAAQPMSVPREVGSFVLVDSTRFDQAALGIVYGYRNDAESVLAHAYVYPVPAAHLALPAEKQLAREAETFVASLPAGVERGWYDAYEVVVDTARTFGTGGGPRPGHLVAAMMRRKGGNHVTFMHLVLIGDHYVKTRLTMPVDQWRNSSAPDFALDLFQRLALPEQPAP